MGRFILGWWVGGSVVGWPVVGGFNKTLPPKTLKLRADVSADVLQNLFNVLSTGSCPDYVKLPNITPVFNKKKPLKKENYVTVSVLSAILKAHAKANPRLYTYVAIEKNLIHNKLC